jgi:hypothetical protein
MNREKINLDIMSTPWTIDTYAIYTSDQHEEMEIDCYNEQNKTDLDYDGFDWTYDHKGLVQWLADTLLSQLRGNIRDNVILAIEQDGDAWSPSYYNYATDNASFTYLVDVDALNKYVDDNLAAYNEQKKRGYDGFIWTGNELETKLAWYLEHKSEPDYKYWDAISDTLEDLQVNGVWYEFISYEPVKTT